MRTEGTDISNGEQPKLPTALPTHPEPRYQTEESSTEASGDPEGTDGNEGAENAEENAGGETPGEASVSEPAAETLPEPASETLPESASEPAAETLTSPASENPSETSEAQPSDGSSGYPFPTRSLQELTAQKAVFLTFDDGPSEEVTPYILDILDQYGIKACFFITYQPHLENLYREIVNRGHTIGIHTACHRYEQIYSSFENWYNDFMTAFNYVIQVTGFTPNVYRFPGGSNQTHSTPEVKAQIIEYLHSHGIEYFDWNVSTEDAVGDKTPEQALEMAMSEFTYRTLPVILMHDGQDQSDTMTMLPALITKIQSMGYTFLPLDATVPPVQQGINWDY
jgi:peptidoglycan/xylan/chitin deacetylase (PgdA/CDA1 family)